MIAQLQLDGIAPPVVGEPEAAPPGESDEFYTPAAIRSALDALGVDLDPCSPAHRPINAAAYCVGSEGVDGLAAPWRGVVFCNPPYSRGSLPTWCEYAYRQIADGHALAVVGLVPARPGSQYWHRWIWGKAAVGFIRGRVVFEGRDGKPTPTAGTFDSALVIWCAALPVDAGGSMALAARLASFRAALTRAGVDVYWCERRR